MKRGQILGILALLLVCAVTVIPAMAANVTVTTTHDVATDYYNYGGLALEAGNYTDAVAYYDQALGSNTTMMNLAVRSSTSTRINPTRRSRWATTPAH